MPKIKDENVWPSDKLHLARLGERRVKEFCDLNKVPRPAISIVPRSEWVVSACAFYRPDTEHMRKGTTPGINICLELCGSPCGHEESRNWSWPGSVTDREPYGVICHELGHYCDWLTGERKGSYYSDYCEQVQKESGEKGVTSYAEENPAEWFAEAFRLFVTNSDLLRHLRPRTHAVLLKKWKPILTGLWETVLGTNVPVRVLRTLRNKGAV